MRRRDAMFSFREPRSYGKTSVFLALVFGAVAGFASGNWLRSAVEEQTAADAARHARLELAAAVCANDFMNQTDAPAALAKLAAEHWDLRAERLAKEGWATMPDRARPETAVARLCASRLGEAYTSVRRSAPVVSTGR